MKKYLPFVILAVLLISSLFIAVYLIKQPQEIREKAAGGALSSITLPTSVSVQPGAQFTFDIYIDTDEIAVSAVDVVLDFQADTSKISVVDIQPNPNVLNDLYFKSFAKMVDPAACPPNCTFDVASTVADANANGKVEFGAIIFDCQAGGDIDTCPGHPDGDVTQPFTGVLGPSQPLATITFLAAAGASGQATITVEHTPGATNDSNLVDAATANDILQISNTLTVTIGGAGVLGDVDCDDDYDVFDAMFIFQYVLGYRTGVDVCPLPPNTLHLTYCSVDGDPDCDVFDAMFVFQCVLGYTGNPLCP